MFGFRHSCNDVTQPSVDQRFETALAESVKRTMETEKIWPKSNRSVSFKLGRPSLTAWMTPQI
ncbi:MAG: hypothetical protein DMF56_10020 [Acidobacteria bacterium]|nr:MAG: hypothetical protein DMF56_10020 [Acidobacteriota bacterium]